MQTITNNNMSDAVAGLTTTRAPFIEKAQQNGELYIHQPYELYSKENHRAWHLLYTRMQSSWEQHANPHFLRGLASLNFDPDHVPRLEDVNKFLNPLTGFRAKPVSGYVPAFLFFDCLRNREFPTTITIRDSSNLEYLPEPDIFHDLAGHVPMHTDRAFADTLVRFGDCAHTAAEMVAGIKDKEKQMATITSIYRALARFFWFTVEFGLMKGNKPGEIKVYGSGLLSSHGEIHYCVESPKVQRYPAQVEWMINQGFEINHFQCLLFVVDSFEHLFDMVGELEVMMKSGKLNNVAPGEPCMSEGDVDSFLRKSSGN